MKNILQRIYDLIIKMISIKGEVLILATILAFDGRLDPIVWGFFAALIIGDRTLEKFLNRGNKSE